MINMRNIAKTIQPIGVASAIIMFGKSSKVSSGASNSWFAKDKCAWAISIKSLPRFKWNAARTSIPFALPSNCEDASVKTLAVCLKLAAN